MEKKLDSNYTRMLWGILNKSRRQHPTKQQLYGHLPPITKTIQVRRTRHMGHSLRSKDKLISDKLLWTPSHGRAKAGRPARTYIQQLCADTGCSLEDLSRAMDDRDGWQERVREIHAGIATWWCTCVCVCVCIYIYTHTHTHTPKGCNTRSIFKQFNRFEFRVFLLFFGAFCMTWPRIEPRSPGPYQS